MVSAKPRLSCVRADRLFLPGDKLLIITDMDIVAAFDPSYATPEFADPPFKDDDWFTIDRRPVSDVGMSLVQSDDSSKLSAVLISELFTPSYHGLLSKLQRSSSTHTVSRTLSLPRYVPFPHSHDAP